MGKGENEDKKVAARRERIRGIVRKTVAFQFGLADGETFEDSSSFIDEMGADSLDCVEFVMAIEEIFSVMIPEEDAEKLTNCGEFVDYLMEKDAKSKLDIDESAIPHK